MEKTSEWEAIRIARKANNYQIKDLARISGMSNSYISEIENHHKKPSLKALEKLAKALNLHLYQLFMLQEYYEELEKDEKEKYRLTLWKALDMIVENNK